MKREEMAMEKVFEAINGVFSFIGPLSDFLWEFPTNFDWYSSIPILGNISFAIILLLGSGIFFSFRIGFMQVTYFKKGIRTMTEKRVVETGDFRLMIGASSDDIRLTKDISVERL